MGHCDLLVTVHTDVTLVLQIGSSIKDDTFSLLNQIVLLMWQKITTKLMQPLYLELKEESN